MTPLQDQSHGRNAWLEALRGLAALWVLLHHANQSVAAFKEPLAYRVFFENGYLGVDFFFVLSGFIIAMSSQSLVDRGLGWRNYLKARFIRIYVPYWPVGLILFALYALLPGLSQGERSPGLWTSVTLLPGNAPPALSVAWTLVHEMLFYLVYLLWFFRKSWFWWAMALWTLAISARLLLGWETGRAMNYVLSPLNLYFLLGILTFRLSQRMVLGQWSSIGLLAASFAAIAATSLESDPLRGWVGIAFAGAVLAFTSPWLRGRQIPRLLVTLGGASYALYLVHNPALSVAIRMVKRAAPALSAEWVFGVISVASLCVGLAYWWIYERNALKLVRRATA
jgi:exopolysaccharide production protein ExoZ